MDIDKQRQKELETERDFTHTVTKKLLSQSLKFRTFQLIEREREKERERGSNLFNFDETLANKSYYQHDLTI